MEMINEEVMLRRVREAMHLADPQYSQEEQQYLATCDILKESQGAEDYIRTKEQALGSGVLFTA